MCPNWCTETQESHLAGLDGWAGFAFHRSELIEVGEGIAVNLTLTTTVDGTPDPTDRLHINLKGLDGDDELPVSVGAEFASAVPALRPGCTGLSRVS